MTNVKALAKERNEIFHDLFRGNVPNRVPVSNPLATDAIIEYADLNLVEVYWDMNRAEKAFDKVSRDFFSDTFQVVHGGTLPFIRFWDPNPL